MGWLNARKLRQRELALLEFKCLLQRFRTGISFSSHTLLELIDVNRDIALCEAARQQPCFQADPRNALKKAGDTVFFHENDCRMFQGFLAELGSSGTREQLEHIELYEGLLENSLIQARESCEKKSRLYLAMGTSGGLSLCLLLL